MSVEQTVESAPKTPSRVNRFFGQYIIKNRLQFKFSLFVFTLLAVASLVIWLEGNWAIGKMIENGTIGDPKDVEPLKNIILYTSILSMAVTFGLSLFFSHFVAGPLYRIEKTFENVGAGDLTTIIRLRKKDELQDTAAELNKSISSLRHLARQDRERINLTFQKIHKLSDSLKSAGNTVEAEELNKILADIENNPPHLKI